MSEIMMEQQKENTDNIDQRALELAQDFSYDGYQVVRRELFAHLREPAVVIRRDSVTFNTACMLTSHFFPTHTLLLAKTKGFKVFC